MANDFKYYCGSNQIAKLPYKTIDALQQLGLYATKNEENYIVDISSDMAENDPDYTASLSAFGAINCSYINTDNVTTYNLYLGSDQKPINDIIVRKIKISKSLTTNNVFTNQELAELKLVAETGDPCILYNDNGTIVLVRYIQLNNSGKVSYVNGFMFRGGSSGDTTEVGQWYASGSSWTTQTTFRLEKQYLNVIKFTTVEGDTCYLNAKSARSSASNWEQVKVAVCGGLTGASNWAGVYSCSGFNAGKVIVGCDLKNKIMYYSDGTNATFTKPTSDKIEVHTMDAE